MDVIVAAATPFGRSALAMLRASGAGVAEVLSAVVRPMRPGPWIGERTRRVALQHGAHVVDDGVAVFRPAERSPTGEDLLELTVHGNPVIVQQVLDAMVDAGARLALPGEFTRRAVLHGRMDLVAAEGVDLVIRAVTPGGVRVGRSALTGGLREPLEHLRTTLVNAIAELEARLDYPDDELALVGDDVLLGSLEGVGQRARMLAAGQVAGRALVEGIRVALVGCVNAGKSSLFNQILGRDRALVHETEGTTRDVVEAACDLGPLHVTLLDTAGERETDDPIEAAGLALARELVDVADVLVVVLRAGMEPPSAAELAILERTRDRRRIIVYNGVDRAHGPVPSGALPTSAKTGEGIETLRTAVVAAAGIDGSEPLVATARQRDRLLQLAEAVDDARTAIPHAGVAVGADLLTHGLEALDELTGADTREDVLDAVFARFCIGK